MWPPSARCARAWKRPSPKRAVCEAKKIIPPKFILQATVKQMQGFTDPSPGQNPFVTVFGDKMAAIQSLPEASAAICDAAAEKVVGEDIYPAWKKAIALLEAQSAKATDDAGLWRLKGGADAYAYFLHRFTTTNLTAAEIHEIGLEAGEDDREAKWTLCCAVWAGPKVR